MNSLPECNIYFTGFMATGKTRIGEATAKNFNWEFIDTDKYIAEKEGITISEIFQTHGEPYFRQKELETVEEISQQKQKIIALGGGAVTNPEILKIIRATGILVRLWAPIDVISERISRKDTRPLMSGLDDKERKAKIEQMLKVRDPYYSQADFSIESNETCKVSDIVSQIKRLSSAWQYKKVEVTTSGGHYPIFIGRNFTPLFKSIFEGLNLETSYLICTDSNVFKAQKENIKTIQKQAGKCRVFQFKAGESFKNLNNLNKLYTYMLNKQYTRKSTLLQFSGGVGGDMAGFAAATYQRGINFIQVPTTLLSMVDSSVGGKVAVNHTAGKNMIGAFYQPKAVLINLDVLETLEPIEYLAGLAEVIKYGVIWDSEFFNWLEANVQNLKDREYDTLEYAVRRCCEIKAEVVGLDEKENNIRAILNYGHTFGHAIEKVTNYKEYSHGIAVSLGMRVAARMATAMTLWKAEDEARQNNLLNAFGFPTTYAIDKEEAWNAMAVDKKADKDTRVYILPSKMGKVEKVFNPPKEMVDAAWDAIG
ncbi:MAG: 3-dehydroquinate synthase [Fibrobacterales bacterium]